MSSSSRSLPISTGSYDGYGFEELIQCGHLLDIDCSVIRKAKDYYKSYLAHGEDSIEDPLITMAACMFIATKSMEISRKLRDIINVCYRIRNPRLPPLEINKTYWAIKKSVITAEFLVLRVLGFEFKTQVPHIHLMHIIKTLWENSKNDERVLENLAKFAYAVVNDSIWIECNNDALLALSAVYLASLALKVDFIGLDILCKDYDVTFKQIEALSIQLCRLK